MKQEKSEEQGKLLKKILSAVENASSGPSQFQSKRVKSIKVKLKKVQLDDPNDPNSSLSYNSDNTFPLLP